MKITDGKKILNVSPKTWDIIKKEGKFREVDDTTMRVAIPSDVKQFMEKKVAMPEKKPQVDEKTKYKALLDELGVSYDSRLGIKRLKKLYDDNKKQEKRS